MGLDGDGGAGPVGDPGGGLIVGGVEFDAPELAPAAAGEDELECSGVGVEQDEEAVVVDALAPGVGVGDLLAVEEHADDLGEGVAPVVVGHLLAVGAEPADVGEATAPDGPPLEEPAAAEHRVLAPQSNEPAGELEEAPVGVVPVVPGELVVLAVGVVVALLCPADLVTAADHGDALGQEQRGQKVTALAGPQPVHLLVGAFTFGAAVPGPVVVGAVAVVFAVGFVVLVFVSHEVGEGETVVG